MRTIKRINDNWQFYLPGTSEPVNVNLPHTWNNKDGQDGDGIYLKGKAIYEKNININLNDNEELFLEVEAASMVACVYINDNYIGQHEGGYSLFRFNLTPYINEKDNLLRIEVDNSKKNVYPQMADFTFYGGLYRNVKLIKVNKNHFELLHNGSKGIKITPTVIGKKASVLVETWQNEGVVEVEINNEVKRIESINGKAELIFEIENVHLWNGREDPYLYKANAKLIVDEECVDEIETKFGCRTFEIDANKGFILNGKEYPLRGVSRHQDRKDIGNALTYKDHEEDFKLIYEMGANSVRLAHYQHAQEFYDLCDEYGLIVWAEIPYISAHMDEGKENTLSQMKELVIQNYNHPSIVVWGMSNEITMQQYSDNILTNHEELKALINSLDNTRKTVIANIGTLSFNHPLLKIPDAIAYNLYFGWYVGELKDNEIFFDSFHKENPNIAIGFSEYGCDTNVEYHTSSPTRGDYTEEYQDIYHEYILNMLKDRKWIWCSYAWNMFDFAADARNEGGAKGINQKGLVTFDRKTKKDVYYLYKAYWTNEPFIHLCSKRYIDRNEHITKIKVYSNLKDIELYVDGELIDKKSINKIAEFKINIFGKHHITIKSGKYKDEMDIKYVETPNENYVLKGGGILNWFDAEGIKEGYYSLEDSASCLLDKEEMKELLDRILGTVAEGDGEDLVKARLDRNYIATLSNISINDFMSESGNEISNNIRRHVNNALQQIKKDK